MTSKPLSVDLEFMHYNLVRPRCPFILRLCLLFFVPFAELSEFCLACSKGRTLAILALSQN